MLEQPAQMTQTGGLPFAAAPFDRNGLVEAVTLASDDQFETIFSLVQTLGKGHFAKVKQVMHEKTGACFAAKVLRKNHGENAIENLACEFNLLKALRHDNIVHLFAAYETPHTLYLVTELCTGGELTKRFHTQNWTADSNQLDCTKIDRHTCIAWK